MNDQTDTLRLIANNRLSNEPARAPKNKAAGAGEEIASHVRTIAVTSGKGGVGKTNFSVNVAIELAMLGRSVTLLDADMALANVDVLFGLNPTYHIGHFFSGERKLREVVLHTPQGVRVIPGSSGIEELTKLSLDHHTQLITELESMESETDFLLVDTAAGIGDNVLGVLRAASEIVVVTMPEPPAIINAYATIKVLHKHDPEKKIWLAVNNVVRVFDAEKVFDQFRAVSKQFLNHPIEFLGSIPHDYDLVEAVRKQQPIVEYAPTMPASRSFRLIAKYLDNAPPAKTSSGSFWRKLSRREWDC